MSSGGQETIKMVMLVLANSVNSATDKRDEFIAALFKSSLFHGK